MSDAATPPELTEAQSEWFVKWVKWYAERGIPLGCCDEWPECSHMLAWYEEHRIVHEPGVFVTLQMRDSKSVDYAFADALLALSELGHDDAVERLRRRWADVVTP